jgi:hypothetical protein
VAPAPGAASLLAGGFDQTRLDVAGRAVRRNLDQLDVVRELELDDAIEPATVFLARRIGAMPVAPGVLFLPVREWSTALIRARSAVAGRLTDAYPRGSSS